MTFLLIAAIIAAMILLYATDRLLKALARARRYRAMSERLDAAAARSEAQHEQRKSAETASAELTSVMPAINRPPLTLPGTTRWPQHGGAGREAKASREAKTGCEAKTGRARPRPAERSGRAGHATGPRESQHS